MSEAGGKGVNVARGLIRSGLEAQALVVCGSAQSPTFLRSLADSAVPAVVIETGNAVRTNISVIEDSGRTTKLNEPGSVVGADDIERLLVAAESAAAESSWIVAAGSLAPGMPEDFYALLAQRLETASCRVAIDASGPALSAVLGSPGVVLKPNEEELAAVWGSPLNSTEALVEAGQQIAQGSGNTVLLSLGAEGAFAITPSETLRGSAAAADVKNTVGAGDSMLAGYIAGYEGSGGSTVEALRSGLAWGRAAVRSEGTGFRSVSSDDFRAVQIEGERQ